MTDLTINAGVNSQIIETLGGNGEDDTITINIQEDFTGSINISGGQIDGEIETLRFVVPEGWAVVSNTDISLGGEAPNSRVINGTIVDDANLPRGNFSFNFINTLNVACFTKGTKIKTNRGNVLIEDLAVGDCVLTLDHGYQPIRWISSTTLDAIDLKLKPKLKPIRIDVGALGDNIPREDLLVSPQHRVFVRSTDAQSMIGAREVLLPANKLLPLEGVNVEDDVKEVVYFHMLFDAHEIVFSNECLTESLYLGKEFLKGMSRDVRNEIEALFPEVLEADFDPTPARLIPQTGKLIKNIVRKHQSSKAPLFEH